jgi:integrase
VSLFRLERPDHLSALQSQLRSGSRSWRGTRGQLRCCCSLQQGRTPEPTDLIFPKWQGELFKTITEDENLRSQTDGRPRMAYSLRHAYISMWLMEGANIYLIAKYCRTSVGMIEKYYGVHVKNSLSAAAINVVRSGKDVMAEEDRGY